MAEVDKVTALCIRDQKLLVVHKQGHTELFSLGGKREAGETDLECLEREVMEEVGCEIKNPVPFEVFEGLTHDGNRTLRLACYFVDLKGEPKVNPEDQIDGFVWIDRDYEKKGIILAGMLHTRILPALMERNLL